MKQSLIPQSPIPNPQALAVPVEYLPPANSIDERVQRVGAYYHSGKRAVAQLVVYNILAGIELIGIKAEFAHGQWLKWCDQNLPAGMSYRSANYFMGLAEAVLPKLASVAGFDFKRLQIANGEITNNEIKPFAEAVQEVTNGKAYTDLLREYGLMAAPKHQKDRDNTRKQTAEETEADRKQAAIDFADLLIANDATFCADNKSTHQLHADLDTAKIKELLDAGLTRNRLCKEILKARAGRDRARLAKTSARTASPAPKKKGSKK
jgi:hypothetical protein